MNRFNRSSNPAFRSDIFERFQTAYGTRTMTIQGATNKALFLLLLAFVAASFTWRMTHENPGTALNLMMLGGMGGFITAMITTFFVSAARFTAPIYAVFEGLLLGAISAVYSQHYGTNSAYGGIVIQALLLTFMTAGGMLFLYRTGIIKVTERFKAGLISAMIGLLFSYFFSFILGIFGLVSPIFSAGPIGIVISLALVVLAALNLVLDFDVIVKGEQLGASEHFEWYAAFGLLVTLIWLYVEFLNLLIKLQRRD